MIPFHQALADEMTARAFTQQHLADGVGVRQNTVSRWVSGDVTPEPATVFRIEAALQLPPGALSRHLGYMPVTADRTPCTVVDAVRDAVELADFQREALLSVYRSFLEPVA